MFQELFNPVVSETFSVLNYVICTVVVILGCVVAATVQFKSHYSRSFLLSLILLPAIVETVIILVNGNLGTGVAVMGAFSLVRFRSAPGSAKEIVSIFLTMAIGLATAIGYLGLATLFTFMMCSIILLSTLYCAKKGTQFLRSLRITVPESLNYYHAFDDLFEQYTSYAQLMSAKTTNMGSLFKLNYQIRLKNDDMEQELINELRCRNGNLEIAIGLAEDTKEEL